MTKKQAICVCARVFKRLYTALYREAINKLTCVRNSNMNSLFFFYLEFRMHFNRVQCAMKNLHRGFIISLTRYAIMRNLINYT